jgi:hypothetical protein
MLQNQNQELPILSSLSRGEIAQLKVQLAAAHKGLTVSIPTTEVRFDAIIEENGLLSRCQIKYCSRKATRKEGVLELQLHNAKYGKKSYSKQDIDKLLVYCPQVDRILSFGPEIFHDKKTITINLTDKKSKWWWENYKW